MPMERVMKKAVFSALTFFLFFTVLFPLHGQVFSETYFTVLPEGTDGTAGTSAKYALFGDWPQSIQPYGVKIDESKSVQVGAFTYFLGSDDNWYAKADYDYYKVEPIKWRIVTDDYSGNMLLLAENVLAGISWYDDTTTPSRTIDGKEVYDNNYEHSKIRAYLNGLSYQFKNSNDAKQTTNNQFLNKGFLQTAFSEYISNYIVETKVDNSPKSSATESGYYKYNTASLSSSEDTYDKIFLLSRKEATTKSYGFGEYYETGYGTARTRYPVPFAEALSGYDDISKWWLRSPYASFYSEPQYVDKNSDGATLLQTLGVVVGEERNLFIESAKKFMGVPYVYGGTSMKGIDCSGLTYLAAQATGIQIPRTAALQYEATTHISDIERQPGDLVFFSDSGTRVTHVGIYIGDGKMLNSASDGKKTGVIISGLSEPYWKRTYYGAGRLFDDQQADLSVKQADSGSTAASQDSPFFYHATHSVFTVEESGSMRVSSDESEGESLVGSGNYGVVPALCVSSDVPVLKDIVVSSIPIKTMYNAGEELDLAGLAISATYSNGKTRPITNYTVSGFNTDLAGTHSITLSCAEFFAEKELQIDYTVLFPFKGTFTGEFKGTEFTELPSGTDGSAGTKGRYALFGDWPQTKKAANISIDETKAVASGANTYYLGSDGAYYAKIAEAAYSQNYTYSDGTDIGTTKKTYAYFKVEPIKWRIVTNDYNENTLLVAENILASCPWYAGYDYPYSGNAANAHRSIDATTVYPNNYEYSTIRAFLNGTSYYSLEKTSGHTQYQNNEFLGKGFLQSAFSTKAQRQILTTTLDNTADSTEKDENHSRRITKYLSSNTSDKVFLLSISEITSKEYGFWQNDDNTNIITKDRAITDYSKASGVYYDDTTDNGMWWLRTPSDSHWQSVHKVFDDSVETAREEIDTTKNGVVPALCIPNSMVTSWEAPVLESLEIIGGSSTITEYELNESVAWILIRIESLIAKYSDGTAKNILGSHVKDGTELIVKGFTSAVPGKHIMTLCYSENGITKELPYVYSISSGNYYAGSGSSGARTDDYKITISNGGKKLSTYKISTQPTPSYDYEEETTTGDASPAVQYTATTENQGSDRQARISNTIGTGYKELPAGTDGTAGTGGKYVLFGEWPQSIKEDNVTINEAKIKKSGMYIYYKGSDGAWYYELYNVYFKVEPIKWRVLTDNYNGNTLLLAENSLIDCQFYDYIFNRDIDGKEVYPNNYEYSKVRAFLNGLSYPVKEAEDSPQVTNTQFLGKGFLQTAFSGNALKVIVPTVVDNSAGSTTDAAMIQATADKYVCSDTTDKVFLLSKNEISSAEFGFSYYYMADSFRIRNASEYLNLMGELPYSDFFDGRYWWLRSPESNSDMDNGWCVQQVLYDGTLEEYDFINDYIDVVPALCIAK